MMRNINDILKYTRALTLLYVEHDSELRQRNEEIFAHYFRDVICASNASEAMHLYIDKKGSTGSYFDLVITDVEMPRVNGIELCRKIFSENIDQKLIALSAHNEPRYLFELINMGVSSFLLKPITSQSLAEALYSTAKSIYDERLIRFRTHEVNALDQKLSELNAALEKADDTIRDNKRFLADINHMIQTPMNEIAELSEQLLGTVLDEKQTASLVRLRHSARLIRDVLKDLYDFSNMETDKMTIDASDFDLNDMLKHVADLISLETDQNNIDLSFHVAKDLPRRYIGDSPKVGRILFHLISSAIRTSNNGSIRLDISIDSGDDITRIVRFDVIRTDALSNEESETFQTPGLSLSKKLSRLMGGDILFENASGMDNTSSLIIPLSLAQPQERRLYRLPDVSMMGKNVLIIDHQSGFADSLVQKFAYFHCHADVCRSLHDVPLDTAGYDIIVIDFGLLHELNRFPADYALQTKFVVSGNPSQLLSKYPPTNVAIEQSLLKPCTQQMLFELMLNLYEHARSVELPDLSA